MLSIGKLGAEQAGYYERQVAHGRDDYYSGKGEAPGSWTGRGAAILGLEGLVQTAQFNAMIAGLDPSAPELQRPLRDSGGAPKVVGFDLTFSAPKSVSVEFATQDPDTSAQLIAAHESAVAAALDYVEDEAIRVRRGHAGAEVLPGDGVIAAAYRHRMSRSLGSAAAHPRRLRQRRPRTRRPLDRAGRPADLPARPHRRASCTRRTCARRSATAWAGSGDRSSTAPPS